MALFDINGSPVLTSGTEAFPGKKIVILGDSISDDGYLGTHTDKFWFQILAEKFGTSYDSLASSGKGYCAATYGTDDILHAQVPRIPADADIILILAGTNDSGYALFTQTLGSVTDKTDDTWYGIVYQTVTAILNNHPTTPLGIITPPPYSDGVRKVADAVKEFCGHYSIDCYDLNKGSGMVNANDAVKAEMFNDGLHPNRLGNEWMAAQLEDWVRMLLRKSNI